MVALMRKAWFVRCKMSSSKIGFAPSKKSRNYQITKKALFNLAQEVEYDNIIILVVQVSNLLLNNVIIKPL